MAAKAKANPIGPGLLKFLRELEQNNSRDWFNANKARYEAEVREPALELIRRMAPKLEKISKYLVASDRKVGGSMMRPYRDVRFSKDKRPFKTNVGIQFRHEAGKDVHAPGFYFHIDPKSVFLGAGMWHPESSALKQIREAIVEDPKGYKRVTGAKKLLESWQFEGDSLKRAPKGYDPEHPMIEALRRKDHIAVVNLKKKDITRPDLPDFLVQQFTATKPFMGWLTKAVGLPF
ncbi:MAG: DUF2461 domain-containing protein [Planctomycetota bacterium]|nr:DUF2461 domain-containing protein [Planctomycetota bacterium]